MAGNPGICLLPCTLATAFSKSCLLVIIVKISYQIVWPMSQCNDQALLLKTVMQHWTLLSHRQNWFLPYPILCPYQVLSSHECVEDSWHHPDINLSKRLVSLCAVPKSCCMSGIWEISYLLGTKIYPKLLHMLAQMIILSHCVALLSCVNTLVYTCFIPCSPSIHEDVSLQDDIFGYT